MNRFLFFQGSRHLEWRITFKTGLEHYRWLSETEHERTLEPSLESIRITVDAFFEQHKKCALIMEGIEYLSGIHGEQRVIEMIRSIVDQTRLNGNVFILTSNLEAFSTQQRSRLERVFAFEQRTTSIVVVGCRNPSRTSVLPNNR